MSAPGRSGTFASRASALYHPRRRLDEDEQMLIVNELGMHTRADLCVQFPPFPLSNSIHLHCPAATEIRTRRLP